ncbi:MAG: hypothetical protein K8R68_08580 [Bacteroidales bacterium]|nr:hypothetical protein [Bacteroidales bacterium]
MENIFVTGWRGIDAGLNLKSTSGWYSGGNGIDLYGFTALPGGYRVTGGSFSFLTRLTYFWSSDDSGLHAWRRYLHYSFDQIYRDVSDKTDGFSVRCVQD